MCDDAVPDYQNAVQVAATHGLDKVLVRLLSAPGERQFAIYHTAFFLAIENGHQNIVELLLKFKPGLITAIDATETPLHRAARFGHPQIAELLLARKPDLIDAVNRDGWNVLHFVAANNGNQEFAARLLARRPGLIHKVTHDNFEEETPLHLAVQHGYDTLVAQLLAHSPQASRAVSCREETCLHMAASGGHTRLVAQLLAHDPTLIDARTEYEDTVLHYAAREGFVDIVTQILALRPSFIDLENHDFWTPLELAIQHDQVKVVAQLLAHKPSLIDKKFPDEGKTPLQQAAQLGRVEIVELLLALKPELVTQTDSNGCMLLHRVVDGVDNKFDQEFVKNVFHMNPDAVHHLNHEGNSPFRLAKNHSREWALELFQWRMSADQIMRDYSIPGCKGIPLGGLVRVWPLIEQQCNTLLEELLPPPGLVELVYEYITLRMNKKQLEDEQAEAAKVWQQLTKKKRRSRKRKSSSVPEKKPLV